MALFIETPTSSDNCVMVVEAKGLGTGLGDAFEQPKRYVETLELNRAKYLVTTDRANLFVYERYLDSIDWNKKPIGYLSVQRLQKEYVLPTGTNLIQTLVKLQPNRSW